MRSRVLHSLFSGLRGIVRLSAGGVPVIFFLGQLWAQTLPPQARYSTHDWTMPYQNQVTLQWVLDYREAFADVKSPGDGRTYAVGTIEVKDTGLLTQAFFSGSPCNPATALPPFDNIFSSRQVVVLQVTDSTSLFPPSPTHPIVWQRYFYGMIAPGPVPSYPSNARGISVWPGATETATRIAICGETYDQFLPGSLQLPWSSNNNAHAGGFIAVFNGAGALLWSHHFFTDRGTGPSYNNGHCAITDVSIRVDAAGNDVVTYCGISSFGNPPGPVDSLSPRLDFTPPTGLVPCQNPTGGATDNGAGQWDGIVGRLSHSAAGTTHVFHSIVGGHEQDGLFGIAEIDENVFVAVGSSGTPAGIPLGTNTFPFTTPACPASGTSQGVVMVFRFPGSGPSGNLQLVTGQHLGGASLTGNTVARDVFAVPRWQSVPSPLDQILIVGSTNDASLLTSLGVPLPGPQTTIGGGQSDGFILSAVPAPGALGFFSGTYRGGPGDDGITGVQGWNEFLDHFVVVGFSAPTTPPNFDIEAESYYIDSAGTFQFTRLTRMGVGGTGQDLPAAMGRLRATNTTIPQLPPSLPFYEYGLGDPAGGGIAVDQSARVNVVGTTASIDYPVSANPPGRPRTVYPPTPIPINDAVRTVLDMLPASVGRTDGTGGPVPSNSGPQYPLPGFFGGTTPQCALSPFGRRIGHVPQLQRMLIDCEEGQLPATEGQVVALLVIRPPDQASFLWSAWQFDFPGAAPGGGGPYVPATLPGGALLWTTNNPVISAPMVGTPGTTLRFEVGELPGSPQTISAQLVCLLAAPVAGGTVPVCSGQSSWAASPALWFTY